MRVRLYTQINGNVDVDIEGGTAGEAIEAFKQVVNELNLQGGTNGNNEPGKEGVDNAS